MSKRGILIYAGIALVGIVLFLFLWFTRYERNLPLSKSYIDSIPPIAELSAEEKRADFEYLADVMAGSFPYFDVHKRADGIDWLANREAYAQRVADTKTMPDFLNTLSSVVHELKDGHTDVLPPEAYYSYRKIYADLLGRSNWNRVLQDEHVTRQNIGWIKRLTADTGYSLLGLTVSGAQSSPEPGGQENLYTRWLAEDAAYVKIPSFSKSYVQPDNETLLAFYRKLKKGDTLVIDIRGNGGGSDAYWQNNIVKPLAKEKLSTCSYLLFRDGAYDHPFTREVVGTRGQPIAQLPDTLATPPEARRDFRLFLASTRAVSPQNSVGFDGKIVLLVDRHVFSASESFASFAKYTGFATLVGERTGGDGIGVDPLLVALPHSGLLVRMPMDMGLNPDGSSNLEMRTPPDIEADATLSPEALLALVPA